MTTAKHHLWTAALSLFALFFLGACQRSSNPALLAYQNKAGAVVGNYARNVSNAFSGAQARGIRGVTQNQSYQVPGWGELYGGYAVRQSVWQEVEDCKDMSEMVPALQQNYEYMVASLSRCLDRLASWGSPINSFSYRNMGSNTQYQWGYLNNPYRPGTLDSFGTDQAMISSFLGQGYYFGY